MNKVVDKVCEAMLELLKVKEYEKISIADLVSTAGINRSSYYYHFYDKGEVVDMIIKDICSSIVLPDKQYLNNGIMDKDAMNKKRIDEFESYKKNFDRIKILYRAGFSGAFQDRLEAKMLEDRQKYEYIFVNDKGEEERIDSGIKYNIKIRNEVACSIAQLKLYVEYGFAISAEKFLDEVNRIAGYHFKEASHKRVKRILD